MMLHSGKVKRQARTGTPPTSAVTGPSAAAMSEAFKQLPVNLAVLDARGVIIDVNDAWKKFGRENGLRCSNFGIGRNYLRLCRSGAGAPAELADNLESMIAAELDLINLVYSCDSPAEARWFSLIALPLRFNGAVQVVVLHIDISSLVRSAFGAGLARTATARAQRRVLVETRMAADAVHGSVGQSLRSQLNKMVSGQRPRSPVGAARRTRNGAELSQVEQRLTRRQQEIFRLLGKGKSNAEIAQALFRSPNTIKLHVSAILKNLDVRNRTQAALMASRLFEPESWG